MAARIPLSCASRRLAVGRRYTLPSYSTSSNHEPRPDNVSLDDHSGSSGSSRQKLTPVDPSSFDSHLDSSAAKIFSHQPVIVPRRPVVRPPPTLTLPPSVSSPAIRSLLPKRQKKSREPDQTIAEGEGESVGDLWNIYQGSLNERDAEPALDDLMVLRPAPHTIRAALEGVLGAGRSLLPENHQLRLDVTLLGAQEAPVGGGPGGKKTVVAGSKKAKKLEYMALYEATERSINQRFTLAQLRHFERELNLGKISRGKTSSKQKTIHRIMYEHFKMMHPATIKEQLAEVLDRIEEFHPVSTSELFILLGRDGENLLHVSQQLQLSISVDREEPTQPKSPATSNRTQATSIRFVLRASGKKTNHRQLKKYLEDLRKSVFTRTVVIPTGPPLPSSRLQTISRTADAFCENINQFPEELEGDEAPRPLVLITARDARNAYTAERLVQRAALEDANRTRIALYSLAQLALPASAKPTTPEYALYPFDTQNIRLQRVKHLRRLPENASLENLVQFQHRSTKPEREVDEDEAVILGEHAHQVGGEEIINRLVIEDDLSVGDIITTSLRDAVDLRQFLFDAGQPTQDLARKVTATLGHVLFKTSNPTSLISPTDETLSGTSALEWTANQPSGSRSFIPGVVPPLVRLTSSSSRLIHRLQYQMVDGGEVVDINVQLPSEEDSIIEPTGTTGIGLGEHDPGNALQTAGAGGEPNTRDNVVSSLDMGSGIEPAKNLEAEIPAMAADPKPLPFEILIGTDVVAEIMIPDSTLDMSLRVSSLSPFEPDQVPEILKTYLDDLSTFFTTDTDVFQPDPPQSFYHEDKHFILVKNTSGQHSIAPVSFSAPGSSVTTETALDLENNARLSFTQVLYDEQYGVEGWASFLRLCQALAAKPYEQTTNRAKPSMT